MSQLLTEQDSKRVADALIAVIGDPVFGIDSAIRSGIQDALQEILKPPTCRDAWLPLTIEEMCDKIASGVVGAAYERMERGR